MEVMAFEDLLEDPVIQKYLHELVGPKGMPVAAAPPDGEVTDEELAEELDLELNDVRRAVHSVRKRSRHVSATARRGFGGG